MDFGIFALLAVIISALLFMVQRTESKRRRFVFILMLVLFELLRRYTWYRDVHTEAWAALCAALLFNFAFFLFIGRYNPVASSDDIRVYRMDD
ncbi:MAG: hypothetical protein SGJ24_14195 [Chloroflexota bacterium]|nr:hypothetical protein [Chloroflexota bacterium]